MSKLSTEALFSYISLLRFTHPPTSLPLVQKSLSRLRPRPSHFDSVIKNHREKTDPTLPFPSELSLIKSTLSSHTPLHSPSLPEINFPPSPLTFLPPHLLHYTSTSVLSPHLDSVRYSGPSISVLTLLGTASLRLKIARPSEIDLKLTPEFGGIQILNELRKKLPETIEIELNAGEGYILSGISRYLMEHEVVGEGERYAVVFRDDLIE
ncbi:hypothetical protein TrST_g8714 [Triparma strigata]|uniref:Uncharacterized protein n=1 Tax=Triparma strigata TaxID=1606541 RepID=A0A9W6ZIQ9_9STRA|nr:hypothetical protein TrST_g8714 [Triparma strigata]